MIFTEWEIVQLVIKVAVVGFIVGLLAGYAL